MTINDSRRSKPITTTRNCVERNLRSRVLPTRTGSQPGDQLVGMHLPIPSLHIFVCTHGAYGHRYMSVHKSGIICNHSHTAQFSASAFATFGVLVLVLVLVSTYVQRRCARALEINSPRPKPVDLECPNQSSIITIQGSAVFAAAAPN